MLLCIKSQFQDILAKRVKFQGNFKFLDNFRTLFKFQEFQGFQDSWDPCYIISHDTASTVTTKSTLSIVILYLHYNVTMLLCCNVTSTTNEADTADYPVCLVCSPQLSHRQS